MTNKQFCIWLSGTKYNVRIPGPGTEKIIDRNNEIKTYDTIYGLGFCNDPKFIHDGVMITKYINGRTCDPHNWDDVKLCMEKLNVLHDMKLKVDYYFDVYDKINEYEKLVDNLSEEYYHLKEKIFMFRTFTERCSKEKVLSHIDSVYDNFLITEDDVKLIDWEYSGMADPDIDVAMFAAYTDYSKDEVDKLINIYGITDEADIIKVYCYISVACLLWYLWCIVLGNDFDGYKESQYERAIEYSDYASELLSEYSENML